MVWNDSSKKRGNAPWGLRIKRARDDYVSRLFNPPQASLLSRDKDDRCHCTWALKVKNGNRKYCEGNPV